MKPVRTYEEDVPMKKTTMLLFTLIALVLVALTGCSGGQEATAGADGAAAEPVETYSWIVQSCFPKNMPLTDQTIQLWADKVTAMSGGRLQITLHGDGEIVPGPEVFEAVRDGALDAGMNTPAWQKGEFPASDLFYTLPGGVTEFHDLFVWLYGYGGMELEQEMYGDQIKVIPLGLTPPEELWMNKEITSLDDFAGLKIRAAGLSMDLFEALGASTVLLGGGEVVPSLQRGVIDAAEFAFPSMDVPLGLPDVASHVYGPPLHMGPNKFQLVINPAKWEELPADLQAIVETAALAASSEGYAKEWIATMEAFEYMHNETDLIITKLSPEVQAQARELTYQILDEKSAEDPFFAKVWESQRLFLEQFEPYDDFTSFD
jgi:TRAP-type mannitol/chloroaromatic compound transport system substrate-binding protein